MKYNFGCVVATTHCEHVGENTNEVKVNNQSFVKIYHHGCCSP